MTTGPHDITAREGAEPFLARWSRLKEETRQQPAEPVPAKADPRAPAPELPPIEKLTLESDYRGFFHPKVSEETRRAALKKLFSDPHFNVMDGLDVYIDDYSKTEPIPPAMLAGLRQAQKIFQWAKEDEEKRAQEEKLAQEKLPLEERARALEAMPPASAAAGATAQDDRPGAPDGASGSAQP